jgi:hypothetical protein
MHGLTSAVGADEAPRRQIFESAEGFPFRRREIEGWRWGTATNQESYFRNHEEERGRSVGSDATEQGVKRGYQREPEETV